MAGKKPRKIRELLKGIDSPLTNSYYVGIKKDYLGKVRRPQSHTMRYQAGSS